MRKLVVILLLGRLHDVLRQLFPKLRGKDIRVLHRRLSLFATLLIILEFLNPFISLVNQFLLPLDVLKHKSTLLRNRDIIWVHFRVLGIKLEDARQSLRGFLEAVSSFEVFAEIIED